MGTRDRWQPHDPNDGQMIARLKAADGRVVTIWKPGSWGNEFELSAGGVGPHIYPTRLELRCLLIELGAKPLPPKTTTSSTN